MSRLQKISRAVVYPLARLAIRLRDFLGWGRPGLSPPRRVWRLFLFLVLLGFLDLASCLFWPPVWTLADHNPASTAFMELRREERATSGKSTELSHAWVDWKNISSNLKLAVTIAEDDKFWEHDGFDLDGIEDALRRNLRKQRISAGGSTITQQLAKNLYLSPSRNPIRKIKEAILAMRLEFYLDKRRILELYLNVAEWGGGVFGAEAASRYYFKTSARNLSPRQAAILASLLPNPLKLTPRSKSVGKKAAVILSRMARRGVAE